MGNDTEYENLCAQCRQPIFGLTGVELYDGTYGWKHDCGVTFTTEFVADHYGVDLSEYA